MSGYIDEQYYKQRFSGEIPDDLPFLIEAASDIIFDITLGRSSGDISGVVLDKVKRATAVQVKYMADNGGVEALNSGEFSQVSLGKFSYASGGSSSSDGKTPPVSAYAITLLESVGLLGRSL